MAMKRVTVDGKTLNKRTADMLHRAEQRLGRNLTLLQGSYNSGVGASAGTHDRGGAIDVSVSGLGPEAKKEIVYQLRKVGFAAWYRTPAQGPWVEHIHAIAIGDPELSTGARAQVYQYYDRRNGLANGGPDDGPRLDPIPRWPIKLSEISLNRAKKQFEVKDRRKVPAVRKIQKLLNHRIGAHLAVDGDAGPKTREAYKHWERRIGASEVDGVPGRPSLEKLVAGYYRVVK